MPYASNVVIAASKVESEALPLHCMPAQLTAAVLAARLDEEKGDKRIRMAGIN